MINRREKSVPLGGNETQVTLVLEAAPTAWGSRAEASALRDLLRLALDTPESISPREHRPKSIVLKYRGDRWVLESTAVVINT